MKTSTALQMTRAPEPKRTAAPLLPPPSPEQVARKRWFSTGAQPRLDQLVGQLYATHHQRVYRFLLRLDLRPADAEEVTSEVFVVALRRLSSYRGAASISTWLLGIARKLASDHRRSWRSRNEVLVDETPEHESFDGPFDALSQKEERCAVLRAVEQLEPRRLAIVRGYALDEKPMELVAKRQRVPAQTAYARLYSAHATLRTALAAVH